MPGGDFAIMIVVLIVGLAGVGEWLIRAVEKQILDAGGDPYADPHGDIAGPTPDSLALLRDRGAL